jgi:peptidoglycan DL-endopeptidase LytF
MKNAHLFPLLVILAPLAVLAQPAPDAALLRSRVEKQLAEITALQAEINSLSQRLGRPVTTTGVPQAEPLPPEPLPPAEPEPLVRPAIPVVPELVPEEVLLMPREPRLPVVEPPPAPPPALPPAPVLPPPAPPPAPPPQVVVADPPPGIPVDEEPGAPDPPPGAGTHVLQTGETFYSIARLHGISVESLQQANPGLDSRRLRPGQVLRLPAGATGGPVTAVPTPPPTPVPQVPPARPAPPASGTLHVVVAGDNLNAIARRYGVTPAAIKAANQLANPDALSVGQKLVIPGAAGGGAAAAAPAAPPPPPASGTYLVKSGDTVLAIARQTGTPVEELRRINSIVDDKIFAGSILKVRRGGGGGGAAAPAPAGPATIDYVVSPGESLFSISRKFFLSQDELAALNGIDRDALLQAGRKLKVPAAAARSQD